MPFSKDGHMNFDKKNLYECKGYNARQFITEFLDKGWTKTVLMVKSRKLGTVDMLTQCDA